MKINKRSYFNKYEDVLFDLEEYWLKYLRIF